MAQEREWIMAIGRRGKTKKQAEEPVAVADAPDEKENTVSDNFDWDQADSGAVATDEAPEAAAEETAAAPKEEGPNIREEFPEGSYVKLIKTDWKNNYAQVTGVEDKRNVAYLSVTLLRYADGRERPEGKQTKTLVRPSSVEKVSELPEVPKAEEKTEAPAES